jgi:hypothetical protein
VAYVAAGFDARLAMGDDGPFIGVRTDLIMGGLLGMLLAKGVLTPDEVDDMLDGAIGTA